MQALFPSWVEREIVPTTNRCYYWY